MIYYIYHIPGKKIGVTRDLKKRVTEQQGYGPDEYDIIMKSDNLEYVSEQEIYLQKFYGYRVDETPYNELKFNNKEMKINVTEQTTTFPCPVNKLKGQLMDNLGMNWKTDHGNLRITPASIDWIMSNVKESMYNEERSYVYNKAFVRYFDNNDPYNGNTIAGAMGERQVKKECDCNTPSQFDLIREWASERGLYENGDPKTQALKLVEEVGETCRAILKENTLEIVDGIGDCVVVLTNLAELIDYPIEECIEAAYDEIKNRTGMMENGTYVKDAK